MKPLNMLSQIWKSFCNQDRLLSSSTGSGRLFFCTKIFAFATAASRASRYHLAIFESDFFKSKFKNICWASSKPDIQYKNALVPNLNGRWISEFSQKKRFRKSALIHSISHQTGTITSGFKGKKRKYHFLKNRAILWYALSRAVHKNRTSQVRFSPSKPDLSGPKKFFWKCDKLPARHQLNLENRMTVCMGYPAKTSQGRAGKRRREGAGKPCRDNGIPNLKLRWYAKPEPVVPISPWNLLRIF